MFVKVNYLLLIAGKSLLLIRNYHHSRSLSRRYCCLRTIPSSRIVRITRQTDRNWQSLAWERGQSITFVNIMYKKNIVLDILDSM